MASAEVLKGTTETAGSREGRYAANIPEVHAPLAAIYVSAALEGNTRVLNLFREHAKILEDPGIRKELDMLAHPPHNGIPTWAVRGMLGQKISFYALELMGDETVAHLEHELGSLRR